MEALKTDGSIRAAEGVCSGPQARLELSIVSASSMLSSCYRSQLYCWKSRQPGGKVRQFGESAPRSVVFADEASELLTQNIIDRYFESFAQTRRAAEWAERSALQPLPLEAQPLGTIPAAEVRVRIAVLQGSVEAERRRLADVELRPLARLPLPSPPRLAFEHVAIT
jgi:hypothetical protein